MKYSDVCLMTKNRLPLDLQCAFANSFDLTDAIEDANDANDLLEKLKNIENYNKTIELDRETDTYIRYMAIDRCDNVHYLIIYKA